MLCNSIAGAVCGVRSPLAGVWSAQSGESAIESRRTSEERLQLYRQLEQRDWQLWTLTLIVLLVLGAFIGAVSLWKWQGLADAGWSEWVRNVFLLGFVGLTLLFCSHVMFQQMLVKRLRRQLLIEETRHRALHLEVSDLESAVANMVSDRERGRVKSEFVTAVSHQLRTPLTSIRNSIDIVLQGRKGHLSEEQGRILNAAEQDIDRLARLIDQLLDLSKIESGRAQFRFEAVDIEDLAGEAVQEFRPAAERKGIELSMKIGDGPFKARADRERIRQVLGNVLANAIQFTPDNGEVRVRVRRVTGEGRDRVIREAHFHPSTREDYVEVSVEDSGVGLTGEDLQSVFDRFLRMEEAGADRTPGRGLSLAVARDLVRAHEGAIWAEKRPGGGTAFRFVLPTRGTSGGRLESLRLIGEAVERARKRNETFSLVVIRVMSVEDDSVVRDSVAHDGSDEIGVRIPGLLDDLAEIARQAVREADTFTVHSALGEIHLFLAARADGEGEKSVVERVQSMVGRLHGDRRDAFADCRVEIGMASFPDDATTAVELEEIARGVELPATLP